MKKLYYMVLMVALLASLLAFSACSQQTAPSSPTPLPTSTPAHTPEPTTTPIITPAPTPTATPIPSPTLAPTPKPLRADFVASLTVCNEPCTVHFTDLSEGEITSWFWEFGDGQISRLQNTLNYYHKNGDFTVSLTVKGPGGTDVEIKTNYIHVSGCCHS